MAKFRSVDEDRRKKLEITDSNFDEELEKLVDSLKEQDKNDKLGSISVGYFGEFLKQLPCDFEKQINDIGEEEWISAKFSQGSEIIGDSGVYQKGHLAYEFKNGFISIPFTWS